MVGLILMGAGLGLIVAALWVADRVGQAGHSPQPAEVANPVDAGES